MSSEPQSNRIAGLTAFAATTFAVCVVAIAALDRAGAPDRLVRALGPVLALIALVVFGVGARNATLALFIAAGRRAPLTYVALAVAAVTAGAAVGLGMQTASPAQTVWPGAMVGVGLGAAALGPLIRRFGAASLGDVVATRFSNLMVRGLFGIVAGAASSLVAFAGFGAAVAVVEALVTASRPAAETLVSAALLASVASGGLASLIWCAAATGGGVILIALLALAFPSEFAAAEKLPVLAAAALPALASPEALASFIAAATGAACLIGAAPPTVACRSAGTAVRAGIEGVLLFIALAALSFSGVPVFLVDRGAATASPVAASVAGAATLAATLALASIGVLGAPRAFGVALARPPRPFATLASVRLARMRVAQTAVVVCCAVADSFGLANPPSTLIAAMALAVAVPAPIAALAAIPRAGPLAAAAAALTAVAVAAAKVFALGAPPNVTDMLIDALAAAAAAFVVGSLIALVAPRRGPAPTPRAFDPFAEPSG